MDLPAAVADGDALGVYVEVSTPTDGTARDGACVVTVSGAEWTFTWSVQRE